MDNPEEAETQCIQDTLPNKTKTEQSTGWTSLCANKHKQLSIKYEPSYKQMEGKDEKKIVFMRKM
jgi:hypothetical protein